jgi:hypothetical protein
MVLAYGEEFSRAEILVFAYPIHRSGQAAYFIQGIEIWKWFCYGLVTNRNADIDIDVEGEREVEPEEKSAGITCNDLYN